MDVFPYFTAACYKGFGDDDDGFYAVYAKVFDQIATEDIEFMASPDEYEQIPKFGTSTSDYDACVGPFYAYWQSYCTKKTYTWLCPHNIQEIRDRRILREVEKETKKIAQKKRKERNDEIRALVAFVRKRDKRVHEYRKLLEAKAEQNRQKQQQHRLAQLRKNQQAVLEMQKNQSSAFTMAADHEEQLRQLEQAYGTDSDYTDDDDDYDEDGDDGDGDEQELENGGDNVATAEAEDETYYIDDLYCVACNKAFKNASSFENHESSKKHRENTERLRRQMQEEDEQYVDESDGLEPDDEDVEPIESETELDPEITSAAADSVDTTATTTSAKKPNKKSKKSKKRNTQQHKMLDDSGSEHELDDVKDSIANVNIGGAGISDGDKDGGAWSDDGGSKKKKKAKNKKPAKKSTAPQTADSDTVQQNGDATVPMAKGANKKGKKAAAPPNANSTATASKLANTTDIDHTCVTCSAKFDSKNKLFGHLKKTNHGVYIPKSTTADDKPANKRK